MQILFDDLVDIIQHHGSGGRHRDDWSVLQLAHAFEQATPHGKRCSPVTNV